MRNIGVTMQMITKVAVKLASRNMTIFDNIGTVLSTTSMSLENLLIILPVGVVWKNDIGARISWYRSLLCKLREAATQAQAAHTPQTLST